MTEANSIYHFQVNGGESAKIFHSGRNAALVNIKIKQNTSFYRAHPAGKAKNVKLPTDE